MKIGFSGTRHGMTQKQRYTLERLLDDIVVEEFHHGDCIGADAQAHDVAEHAGFPIVIHPPTIDRMRAFKRSGAIVLRPKSYALRNLDIVKSTDLLIAAPRLDHRTYRSGTWMTVGFAMDKLKQLIVIWPTGLTTNSIGELREAFRHQRLEAATRRKDIQNEAN